MKVLESTPTAHTSVKAEQAAKVVISIIENVKKCFTSIKIYTVIGNCGLHVLFFPFIAIVEEKIQKMLKTTRKMCSELE